MNIYFRIAHWGVVLSFPTRDYRLRFEVSGFMVGESLANP